MDAARELFQNNGFQKVSMRQIANKLGYSHGSIYYHFNNKAELFYAIVDQDFKLLDHLLEETMNKSYKTNEEHLQELCMVFIQFSFNYKSHYEMMFLIKDRELDNIKNASYNSYEQFSKAVLQLCPQHANIHSIFSLFLSLQGFITHYINSNVTFKDIEHFAKAHIAFVIRGLL